MVPEGYNSTWPPNFIESPRGGDSGWYLAGLSVFLWWYRLLSGAVIVLMPVR
jgi:hypothetical protein